jgi:mannose-6-phosphate isomerase-like protein (cupin superfamily)
MDFQTFQQSDAKKYPLPGGTCWLYPDCPTGRLSCALVEQDGRYPEEGFRKNSICTESMFVLDGEFTLTVGESVKTLKKHDLAYIPLDTPYSIEGKGSVFVFIEPKWDSAQNVPA